MRLSSGSVFFPRLEPDLRSRVQQLQLCVCNNCSILSMLPDFARVSLARVSAPFNLQREGKANKKATEEREERTTAHKTANAILEDQHKHTDTHLPAPPLFDVVYRIPEASLKLARDDRQAGLHYKKQRQAMVLSQSGAVLEEKPKRFPALLLIM